MTGILHFLLKSGLWFAILGKENLNMGLLVLKTEATCLHSLRYELFWSSAVKASQVNFPLVAGVVNNSVTQLFTGSAKTSAQLFIASHRSRVLSGITNPSQVCPCLNRTPQQQNLLAGRAVWLSVLVSLRRARCFQSLLFFSNWPIVTDMSRRQRQPITCGPGDKWGPIRSGVPMVTCARAANQETECLLALRI